MFDDLIILTKKTNYLKNSLKKHRLCHYELNKHFSLNLPLIRCNLKFSYENSKHNLLINQNMYQNAVILIDILLLFNILQVI